MAGRILQPVEPALRPFIYAPVAYFQRTGRDVSDCETQNNKDSLKLVMHVGFIGPFCGRLPEFDESTG